MKKKLHTTKIVAQYLDLSERRVRQLRDEGVLEEKAPGLYDLRSSVRRYINYLRGDEGGKADLNEERAKLTKEKRIAAETENKVRNGELYRKSDIMTGMTTIAFEIACPAEQAGGEHRQAGRRRGQDHGLAAKLPPRDHGRVFKLSGRIGAAKG